MLADKKPYIPTVIIFVIGLLVIALIPSQIDLSRVRGRDLSNITSRTLPYVITVGIVLLAALELFFERRRRVKQRTTVQEEAVQENATHEKTPGQRNFFSVFLTFIGIVVWIMAIPYLGFIITTTALLIGVMLLMGNRKWLQLILIPLLTGLLLNYVFTEIVGRNLPQGIIFY